MTSTHLRRSDLVLPVLLLGLLGACASPPGSDQPPADRIFVGGPVLTIDPSDSIAEAVAVRDGRIVAVGSRSDIEALRGDTTEVTDLEGRALLPGFHDAHSHLILAGQVQESMVDLTSPPVGNLLNVDDVVAALSERADQTPAGEWVLGMGYDDTLVAEKRHPTRNDLDRVSTEHPVVAIHVSGHLMAVNSRALEMAGIDASTPQPTGGHIQKGADGEPNGVLEELPAFGRIYAMLPQPDEAQRLAIVRAIAETYVAAGVTTAQNGYTNPQQLQDLAAAAAEAQFPLRVVALPDAATARALTSGELEVDEVPGRLDIGAVKITADGSIQGYTGYLAEPYHVPPGDDPTYNGYPVLPREELHALIDEMHRAGWQLAIHGNGDQAIQEILDGFEKAFEATPRDDPRPFVIHAQMARDDQLDQMARLGAIPSFFVLHTYYWGDRHRDIFMGPERAARMSPTAAALEREIPFTIHTDTPIVPMEPLRLVWSAVNRITSGGEPIGPDQRIGVMEAIRATTWTSAYQHRQEGELGSIEVGKLADLVIVSGDPRDDPSTIDELTVEETIVGGKTVFRREG